MKNITFVINVAGIAAQVTRCDSKNIELSISMDSSVSLSVPYGLSKKRIRDFIQSQLDVIRQKQAEARTRMNRRTVSENVIKIQDLEITVTRKNIKSMNLKVSNKDASVKVSAPAWIDEAEIIDFIQSKMDWIHSSQADIREHLAEMEEQRKQRADIYLWGNGYKLEIQKSDMEKVEIKGDKLILYMLYPEYTAYTEDYLKFMRHQALSKKIKELAPKWEKVVGKSASEYVIRDMVRTYGNCRPRTGRITINEKMVCYPVECLEYVLVHELVHFHEEHHNERFWSLVEKFYPNYRQVQCWMKHLQAEMFG